MAHKFDRTGKDPYAEASRRVVSNVYSGRGNLAKGASDETISMLSNAIVTALGDIAAQAYRHGVNDPAQVKGLARAIAQVSECVLVTYEGEVDAEPTIQALENDTRCVSLAPEAQDKLHREIEKTRQLEALLLHAKRLPDLIDFCGSLGLRVQEDGIEEDALLTQGSSTPAPGTA